MQFSLLILTLTKGRVVYPTTLFVANRITAVLYSLLRRPHLHTLQSKLFDCDAVWLRWRCRFRRNLYRFPFPAGQSQDRTCWHVLCSTMWTIEWNNLICVLRLCIQNYANQMHSNTETSCAGQRDTFSNREEKPMQFGGSYTYSIKFIHEILSEIEFQILVRDWISDVTRVDSLHRT